jgi:hypothetical protein
VPAGAITCRNMPRYSGPCGKARAFAGSAAFSDCLASGG